MSAYLPSSALHHEPRISTLVADVELVPRRCNSANTWLLRGDLADILAAPFGICVPLASELAFVIELIFERTLKLFRPFTIVLSVAVELEVPI